MVGGGARLSPHSSNKGTLSPLSQRCPTGPAPRPTLRPFGEGPPRIQGRGGQDCRRRRLSCRWCCCGSGCRRCCWRCAFFGSEASPRARACACWCRWCARTSCSSYSTSRAGSSGGPHHSSFGCASPRARPREQQRQWWWRCGLFGAGGAHLPLDNQHDGAPLRHARARPVARPPPHPAAARRGWGRRRGRGCSSGGRRWGCRAGGFTFADEARSLATSQRCHSSCGSFRLR